MSALETQTNLRKLKHENENISRIEGFEKYPILESLSLAFNRIVVIENLGFLRQLKYLNLSNNSITTVSGMNNLINLEWLDLSDNSIQDSSELNSNRKLKFLKLSDNALESLPNLVLLANLKELYLCGNMISSTNDAQNNLPDSLQVLSLTNNDIEDINQFSHLRFLKSLIKLQIEGNPLTYATNYTPEILRHMTGLPHLSIDEALSTGINISTLDSTENKQQADVLVINSVESSIDKESSTFDFNSLDQFLEDDQISLDTLTFQNEESNPPNDLRKSDRSKLSVSGSNGNLSVKSNQRKATNSQENNSVKSFDSASLKSNNSFDARDNRPLKSLDPHVWEREVSENSQLSDNAPPKPKSAKNCIRSVERSGMPLMACFKKTQKNQRPASPVKSQRPTSSKANFKSTPKSSTDIKKKAVRNGAAHVIIIQSTIRAILCRKTQKSKTITESKEKAEELTNADRQMIELQTQAIRRLWHEIEGLKKWKENIEKPSQRGESNFAVSIISSKLTDNGYGKLKIYEIRDSSVSPVPPFNGNELLLPGVPTVPYGIRHIIDGDVVILSWMPSLVFDEINNHSPRGLLGYRICIDGIPRGCVYCIVNAVKIIGFDTNVEYKLHITAFSTLGESADSEPVFVTIS